MAAQAAEAHIEMVANIQVTASLTRAEDKEENE